MRIHVWVAGRHDRESQRSLINAFLADPGLHGADISLQPAPQAPDTMGPGFDVIQLVVDSGFQLAALALAFVTWRQSRDRAGQLVVQFDGATRTLSGEDLSDVPAAMRALSGQPDPGRSCCVLVGVSRYPHLGDLPAVERNCVDLAGTLVDPGIWGVPWENCRMVLNPATSRELLAPVEEAAQTAEDTLVVYFAGHGLCDSGGEELRLCLPGATGEGTEPARTVPWRELRTILRAGRARRRVVILDCCYSGLALDGSDPSSSLLNAAKSEGIYTLTAAAKHSLALAPRSARHTAFTGEIIRVLRDPQSRAEFLTLDDLFHKVREVLQPEPQREGPDHVGSLPYFRVPQPEASPSPEAAPGTNESEDIAMSGRRRLLLWSAPLALTVAAATAAVALWPAGPHGPCSADTTLLGVSDDLDHTRHEGMDVGGLSAITMRNGTEAMSLTDNSPPRLFHLTLGDDPRHADITRMTTLRHADGSDFRDHEFDGEGLVVQQHNIWVSSETPSGIFRFDHRTGVQKGALDIPKLYRARSQGGDGPAENFESLTTTPNGKLLFTGLEEPLWRDGKGRAGQPLLRILRYSGMPDQDYKPDGQYGYKADIGLSLVDMVAVEDDQLLTLERGYMQGVGNAIRVYRTTLGKRWDLGWDASLKDVGDEDFAKKEILVDLAACPAGNIKARDAQPNPLLQNVEGMALGPVMPDRRRSLYLVSDNNFNQTQTTRLYKLDIPLSGTQSIALGRHQRR